MAQTSTSPMTQTAFRMLIGLSMVHLINDALQSVISASYPLLNEEMGVTFTQIGIITLVYQMSASVFQPFVGLIFDKRPFAWSLPIGMMFTLTGLISLSFVHTFYGILVSVFLVGIGSSVTHPEASRLTSLASGGRRGLAQSIFQVGGNFGGALGPLLVAFLVAPYGRQNISWLSILALLAILIMVPISHWYSRYLAQIKIQKTEVKASGEMPLPMKQTVMSIGILLILIFSKYVYTASISSYYTFYLIEKFNVTISHSQVLLFVFLLATAIGTMLGGPIGDRIGRKYVIWISILGAAPFTLLLPYVPLFWTVVLTFCIGLIISSAFPAILVYAQELLPYKLGLVSGLFFGLAFGIGGIASAVLGKLADMYGIELVYRLCSFMPLLGLVTWFLPDLKRKK